MGNDTGASLRRIVVGVDGSEHSKWALRWASGLGGAHTVIDAVIAWEYPLNYGVAGGVDLWRPDGDATHVLDETLSEVFRTDRPAGLNALVREGGAAVVLLDAARDADLLVVGSRGHGGFVGLLLGSVSAKCAEHATCAVLVVHGPPPWPA